MSVSAELVEGILNLDISPERSPSLATQAIGCSNGVSRPAPIARARAVLFDVSPEVGAHPGTNSGAGAGTQADGSIATPAMFRRANALGLQKLRLRKCSAGDPKQPERERRPSARNGAILRQVLCQQGFHVAAALIIENNPPPPQASHQLRHRRSLGRR